MTEKNVHEVNQGKKFKNVALNSNNFFFLNFSAVGRKKFQKYAHNAASQNKVSNQKFTNKKMSKSLEKNVQVYVSSIF